MKKLIVCLALTALAFVPAMQAGDAKTCDASKAACCADKAKVVSATKAKDACCAKATTAKVHATSKGGSAALLVKN